MKRKIIFMGSPVFAVPSLVALRNAGHEILAVYSQPPRPAGRGGHLQKTPVHQAAEDVGLVVRTPLRLQDAEIDEILAMGADVVCVVGYGLLLPRRLVESVVCVNVHPSALPRWRGASPVQHAVMFGDSVTEVCIMRLEAGMDSGPVYKRIPVAIGPEMTAGELNEIVWPLGAEGLVEVVGKIDEIEPLAQVGEVTLAPKINNLVKKINWRQNARDIANKIRGLSPDYAATFELNGELCRIFKGRVWGGNGADLGANVVVSDDKVGMIVQTSPHWVVQCGVGQLEILEIQRPGKRVMGAAEALRGWPQVQVGGFVK